MNTQSFVLKKSSGQHTNMNCEMKYGRTRAGEANENVMLTKLSAN